MASTSSSIVFDDIFTTDAIDKDGKKFDRVSRLYARSKNYDMDLMLDHNIELFPLVNGDSLRWPLLRHYPEMAVHPPQMARMTTTKIETYGDQMVKEGEVWKKIMTMLCMGRCTSLIPDLLTLSRPMHPSVDFYYQ